MDIFYDHQTFSVQTFGGISRYFAELISGINRTTDYKAYLPLLFSNNIHLRKVDFKAKAYTPDRNFYKKLQIIYRLNQAYTVSKLHQKSFDVFHATYYDPYFIPYLKGKPFVVTFHDMIHEKFSNQYKEFENNRQFMKDKKLLAEQATHIIAVSENTKKDLVDMLGISPNKIQVIYHGNSLMNNTLIRVQSVEPYLLYVGNRQRYKNFQGLLRSIAPLLKRHRLTLVCAGGGRFDTDEQTFIQSLQMSPYVQQRYIDDDETLCHLYKSAIAFVFPSKYEGFGIPILEAFACECPCILSNSSSLPEVGGESALYFDPDDDNSIRYAVEQVINNRELRDRLVKNGSNRLAKFSWDRTIRETLTVYDMCCRG